MMQICEPDAPSFWRSKVGTKLDGLKLFYHIKSDKGHQNPLFLNITLSGSTITIIGSPDGEGLCHEVADAKSMTFESSEIVMLEGSDIASISPLLGHLLCEAGPIMDVVIGDELGLYLSFDHGQLLVLNIGDEIFLSREPPEFIDRKTLSFTPY